MSGSPAIPIVQIHKRNSSGKTALTFSLGAGSGEELQVPAWRSLQQEQSLVTSLE